MKAREDLISNKSDIISSTFRCCRFLIETLRFSLHLVRNSNSIVKLKALQQGSWGVL